MQEARPVAERHGAGRRVAQLFTDGIEQLLVARRGGQVGHDPDVVAGTGQPQVRQQQINQIAVLEPALFNDAPQHGDRLRICVKLQARVLDNRFIRGKNTATLKVVEQRLRVLLAFAHVGLIERVNVQHIACDRRRQLPAEELAAQFVGVRQPDRHDRHSGALHCVHLLVKLGFGAVQAQVNQELVVIEVARVVRDDAGDRDHTASFLTRALRDKLLCPQAKAVDLR